MLQNINFPIHEHLRAKQGIDKRQADMIQRIGVFVEIILQDDFLAGI